MKRLISPIQLVIWMISDASYKGCKIGWKIRLFASLRDLTKVHINNKINLGMLTLGLPGFF